MKTLLMFSFFALLATSSTVPAFAHTTVDVEPYEIEVGWEVEPPVVGLRNDFVFEISEPGDKEGVKRGVINAFNNLEATAKFGGVTKTLDINSDPSPGHYFSPVIPTRTGTIAIQLSGTINDTPVDVEIPVEDVESTAVLDFPPTTGSSSNQDVAALKSAVSSIQKDVASLESKVGNVQTSDGGFDMNTVYNFGIFGISLGAAGVILAIISMVKRK